MQISFTYFLPLKIRKGLQVRDASLHLWTVHLHGEDVESTVNNGNGASYELCSVAHQIVYSSA